MDALVIERSSVIPKERRGRRDRCTAAAAKETHMKKLTALFLAFAVAIAPACTTIEPTSSSASQASEILDGEYGSDAGVGSDTQPGEGSDTYPGDGSDTEPGDGSDTYPGGGSDTEPVSTELDPEYGFDLDWKKTANCTANFAGLTGMAVAAAAAVVLAGAVIAELAAGAGAGTALASAWADVVAIVGSIKTGGDVGAAIALLIERFGTFKNVLVGIGTTAAALGITQAAKDTLDEALKTLEDYGTGWSNYWKCCMQNDNTACPNMPFNVF